jgi:hypothetical protein
MERISSKTISSSENKEGYDTDFSFSSPEKSTNVEASF